MSKTYDIHGVIVIIYFMCGGDCHTVVISYDKCIY